MAYEVVVIGSLWERPLFPMRCCEWAPEGTAVSFQCTMWMRGLSDVRAEFQPAAKRFTSLRLPENESHLLGDFRSLQRVWQIIVVITRIWLCLFHTPHLETENEYLWEECCEKKISLLWVHSGKTLISRWSFIVSNYCAISWMGFVRAGHSGG